MGFTPSSYQPRDVQQSVPERRDAVCDRFARHFG
jgi:hypothetical protein